MAETVTDEQGRPEPPAIAGEAATLIGFLEFLRGTVEWKTRGLTDEQLRTPLAPTDMTLAGLLAHLAFVEDYWVHYHLGGQPPNEPFASVDWDADRDYDWHMGQSMTGDELRALWLEQVARSRTRVAGMVDLQPDALDSQHGPHDGRFTMRWVLVHLVEEYARHCGHADLLRQNVDGMVGE